MKATVSDKGTIRLIMTTDEWREISEAFYASERPESVEFESDDGRHTVAFEVDR